MFKHFKDKYDNDFELFRTNHYIENTETEEV